MIAKNSWSWEDASVSDRHPALSIVIICVLVFLGFYLVGPILGLLISDQFDAKNLMQALEDPAAHPEMQSVFLISQGAASVVGLILFPLGYVLLIERKPVGPFFRRPVNWAIALPLLLFIAVNFMVSITPVIAWNADIHFPSFLHGFERWAREREDYATQVTRVFTSFPSSAAFATGLLVIALLPGVGEELVFRGLIQNEFRRGTGSIHAAIWLSAALFSAIHVQFFGFFPRLILGALFGYLYYWSGNLLVPMLAHFFHNGITLTLMYLYQLKVSGINIDTDEAAPWGSVAFSAVATVLLLYIFRRINSSPSS